MYLQGGIASSTHVDRHGDRVDRSLLQDMARQINAQYVPLLIDHDFNRQVGVVLSAKLAELADGEYGLLVISGIFENREESESLKIGAPNTRWQDFEPQLREIGEQVATLIPPGHADTTEDLKGLEGITARLQAYFDSTEIMPDGSIYLVKRHIASIGDMQIDVYPKDHDPPHFHVASKQRRRGFDARFHIETLGLLSYKYGRMRDNDIRRVQEYFRSNPDDLKTLRNEYERLR